jgi:hypothetical protein
MPDFFSENLATSVTPTDAGLVSLGQRGCVCIFNEDVATGNFAAVQCITDCSFLTLDTVEGAGASSPFHLLVSEATTCPAGTILYGPFTQVQNSGAEFAICYKA